MADYAADIAAIRTAAARIAGQIHRTPVATCASIDLLAGRSLFFKCEHLQKVGAFKFRGASNAVLKLEAHEAARGVVAHSSGNHAQAVALAARLRGIPAHIVMPRTAPVVKKTAVLGYGARVLECEPTLEAREAMAAAVVAETGGAFIHPYDNADVIAGQGTTAIELLEQASPLDALVVPVGGGGLLSGMSIAARALSPQTRIFAAEPLGADDMARSFAAGVFLPQRDPRTIADGLLTSMGQLTWPILRDHVERVVTVREDEIVAAMRLALERGKLLIEPSGAVALAAVLTEEFRGLSGLSRVGVVLTGGNVDLDHLPWA